MGLFTFFCLLFIGQLPVIADVHLGVDPKSTTYGWIYAVFDLGGLTGAFLIGTAFLRPPSPRIAPVTLAAFSASRAWLTLVRSVGWACVAIYLVGLFYFSLPTALATAWQEHVDSSILGCGVVGAGIWRNDSVCKHHRAVSENPPACWFRRVV
ncbi:MAG: hypothetical protein QMA93_01835 [Acidimicrobiales bacterium]